MPIIEPGGFSNSADNPANDGYPGGGPGGIGAGTFGPATGPTSDGYSITPAKKSKKVKGRKAKKPKQVKAKKAKKPKKVTAKRFTRVHASVTKGSDVGDPWRSARAAAAGSAMGAIALSGASGIAVELLELAGEGKITLSSALTAWQREDERVSNRTWRRPGGLAKMGGL